MVDINAIRGQGIPTQYGSVAFIILKYAGTTYYRITPGWEEMMEQSHFVFDLFNENMSRKELENGNCIVLWFLPEIVCDNIYIPSVKRVLGFI